MHFYFFISLCFAASAYAERIDYKNQQGWEPHICQAGKNQSPVNLIKPASNTKAINLKFIKTSWKPLQGDFKFLYDYKFGIKVNKDQGGVQVQLNGNPFSYELAGVHVHLPSEHRISHTQYPMEMHFVHKLNPQFLESNPELARYKYLVIGVFFEKGETNNALERLSQGIDPKSIINIKDGHFAYEGSLTTPSCKEAVLWVVLETPLSFSELQNKKFQDLLRANGYGGGNARKIQPLNNRQLNYYPSSI